MHSRYLQQLKNDLEIFIPWEGRMLKEKYMKKKCKRHGSILVSFFRSFFLVWVPLGGGVHVRKSRDPSFLYTLLHCFSFVQACLPAVIKGGRMESNLKKTVLSSWTWYETFKNIILSGLVIILYYHLRRRFFTVRDTQGSVFR